MRIHRKNVPAKFHPNPILNTAALRFLKTVAPTERQQEQDHFLIQNTENYE